MHFALKFPLYVSCPLSEKDPRFKPSMLEPPKPRFKEVTLTGGPIIKSHKAVEAHSRFSKIGGHDMVAASIYPVR